MKKIISISVMALLFFAFTSICLAQFEGVVNMKILQKSSKGEMDVTQEVFIKGDKMRSNMTTQKSPMGPITMIIRRDKGVVWTIMDAMKMYMETSLQKTEEMAKSMQRDTLKPTIAKSGKTQTILGHKCEEILVTTSDMKASLWGTTELSSLAESMKRINSSSASAQSRWMQEVEKMKMLVLKIHEEHKSGMSSDLEITAINKKAVDDSQFEIPAGYTKQEMPTGMPPMGK